MDKKALKNQREALDPMQAHFRKVLGDEKQVHEMKQTPNLERVEALKFLADEGQKCDRVLECADTELMRRALDYLKRVRESYASEPGFASNVGLNGFNYIIEDLENRIK